MNFSHVVAKTLWAVPLVLQAAIAVAMLRRRLVRVFPVFFTYTVLVSSRDVALLFIPYNGNLYSSVYWYGDALAILLGLGVILEAIWHFFPAYPFLRIILKPLWILGAVAAAASVLLLVSTSRGAGATDPLFEVILLLERSARFLQACLLIAVIALMSRLGLTWHQQSVGIVAGFGVYSALDLAVLELRAHLHVVTDATFVLLTPAAYNLAAIIWAFYFLRSWRRKPVADLPKTNLAEWNETVTRYIDQWHRRY